MERERDEIGAFQAYRISVTALDRAQGTILRNRNIDIADVATAAVSCARVPHNRSREQ